MRMKYFIAWFCNKKTDRKSYVIITDEVIFLYKIVLLSKI